MKRRIFNPFIAVLVLLLPMTLVALRGAVAIAAPREQIGAPSVVINSPPNNASFNAGQTVTISATSTDPTGITNTQLFVDNLLSDSAPMATMGIQVQVTSVFYWQATPGTHVLTVRATNTSGLVGQAAVVVNVGGSPPGPTRTPNPCVVSARFLGDVTIPDNTTIQPGQPFVKTWSVLNNGSCIWISTYSIQNISGGTLGAQSPSSIPYTAPGQTSNISLNMVAPSFPGTYRSVWQLRAPNGVLFGPQLDVQIIVPQPGCSGNPQITSFYASPSQITFGQSATLVWGPVYNADSVKLQTPLGSSNVQTPGQVQVSPQTTTGYVLTGFCKGNRVDSLATVSVSNPIPPTPIPPQNTVAILQVYPSSSQQFTVNTRYFWNGQGAPAQLQVMALDAVGNVLGMNTSSGLVPSSTQTTTVNVFVSVGTGAVVTLSACMVDRTGVSLACASAPAR